MIPLRTDYFAMTKSSPTLRPLCALFSLIVLSCSPAFSQENPAEQLIKLYSDGNYTSFANQGLVLLLSQPWNHELRFFVANSLSWTGRNEEAAVQYESLAGTEFSDEASLGLANMYRWNGRPDRSQPLYQAVLNEDPTNQDAQDGLTLAQRELRGKTSVSLAGSHDSNAVRNGYLTIKHQWRDADNVQQFELEGTNVAETNPTQNIGQSDITFRYANPALPMAPHAEISAQTTPDNRLFGKLTLNLTGTPLSVTVGHVNWAKMAQNPVAVQEGLSANQFGGNLDYNSSIGRWRASYTAYQISDSNLVQDESLLYTPVWQPFKSPDIKTYVGFTGRNATVANSNYWAPDPGKYYAVAGINAEWTSTVWSNSIGAQYGIPLSAGVANSWSLSAGAHRHFGPDWAVGIDLFAQSSQRATAYSAQNLTILIEKLW